MLKSIATAVLAGVLWVAHTGASAQTDLATAQTLMRKSGLWEQLDSFRLQVRAGITDVQAQSPSPPTAGEVERLLRVADSAFAAAHLRTLVQGVIAQDIQAEHIPAVLAWYQSPLGTAVAQLEAQANADVRDPRESLQKGSALFASLPAARQAQLRDCVRVTRAAETSTNTMLNALVAIQVGIASTRPQGPAISARDIRNALEPQRPQLLQMTDQMALASFTQIYANLTDAELAAYITYLGSAAGTHYIDLEMQAVDAAMVESFTELGRRTPGTSDKSQT